MTFVAAAPAAVGLAARTSVVAPEADVDLTQPEPGSGSEAEREVAPEDGHAEAPLPVTEGLFGIVFMDLRRGTRSSPVSHPGSTLGS